MKVENPNMPGFQHAGPVLRLHSSEGQAEYRPSKNANLLNDPPFSEARWLWAPISIPLGGSDLWERSTVGTFDPQHVRAVSISLDSWGWEPFTVWLDGLGLE